MIAFDAASSGTINNVSSSSHTVSHTCTGDDLILIVTLAIFTGDKLTGITYNSVSMTQVPTDGSLAAGSWQVYMYYLINPSSGTHNITASFSPNAQYSLMASASYTGVSQVSFPDASDSGTGTSTSVAGSVTTTVDNCWTVMGANCQDGNIAAGSGTTIRATSPTLERMTVCDSGGAISPAGSDTLTVTCNNDVYGYCIVSMAPVAAATATSNFLLLGVG